MTVSKLTNHVEIPGKKTAKGNAYYNITFDNNDSGETTLSKMELGKEYNYTIDKKGFVTVDFGGGAKSFTPQSTYTPNGNGSSNTADEIRKAVALKAAVEYCAQRSDKTEEDVMLMAAKYYNWLKDGLPF